MQKILRFNPYNMPDDLILNLNTGREKELEFASEIIKSNIDAAQAPQHILISGPRGIGKSFFLRLIQIELKNQQNIEFYLFPEEQENFFQPVDLLKNIQKFILNEPQSEYISKWDSGGRKEWDKQLENLKKIMSEQNNTNFVIGIENFDLLFKKNGAFENKKNQFLLRHFLTHTPKLTLIATTLYPDLDTEYDKALFHMFAKHELMPWQDLQHEAFFNKKMEIDQKKASEISHAQLKALTKFTGGIPRITVIISDILSKEGLDPIAQNLEHTIDGLTAYYQDLLSRIPTKSKMLFDALIRGGEPCSQSELAKRVGTAQNVIAKSFNWLITHKYLTVDIPEGERQRIYSVRDRLFAHYYRMRQIDINTNKSVIAIMSEFLTTFYTEKRLRRYAKSFLECGDTDKSRDLLHIIMKKSGIETKNLSWKDDVQDMLNGLNLLEEVKGIPFDLDKETFDEDESIDESQLKQMQDMLSACQRGPKDIDKKEFAKLLFDSISFSKKEKLKIAQKFINGKIFDKQWQGFFDILKEEELKSQGIKLSQLGKYKEAVTYHKNALELSIKEKNISGQVRNLEQIGWNLEKFGKYAEAITYRKQALELVIKENNILDQTWNVTKIGLNFQFIDKHEEAIKYYKQALELAIKENNVSYQLLIFLLLGTNLEHVGKYEEAIKYHNQRLKWAIKKKDIEEQAWNLGRISTNLLLLKKENEAWSIIDDNIIRLKDECYSMIDQLGYAVTLYIRQNKTAEAFSIGVSIIDNIKKRVNKINLAKVLQNLFTGMFQTQVNISLIEDLYLYAINEFNEEIKLSLEGIHGMIEYIKSEKSKNVLIKMQPDKRRAVETLINELEL
jgi:tetratricopeptide (TPR) repeat protein